MSGNSIPGNLQLQELRSQDIGSLSQEGNSIKKNTEKLKIFEKIKMFEPRKEEVKTPGKVLSPLRRPRKHQDSLSGTSPGGMVIIKPGNIAHTRGWASVIQVKDILEHSTAQVQPLLINTNTLIRKGHLRT